VTARWPVYKKLCHRKERKNNRTWKQYMRSIGFSGTLKTYVTGNAQKIIEPENVTVRGGRF